MNNTKRVNCYSCRKCRRAIFTVDRWHGVTPMMLKCRATPGCGGVMYSHGYPEDDWFELTPVKWEWVAPESGDINECMQLRKLPISIPMKDLPDFEAKL